MTLKAFAGIEITDNLYIDEHKNKSTSETLDDCKYSNKYINSTVNMQHNLWNHTPVREAEKSSSLNGRAEGGGGGG